MSDSQVAENVGNRDKAVNVGDVNQPKLNVPAKSAANATDASNSSWGKADVRQNKTYINPDDGGVTVNKVGTGGIQTDERPTDPKSSKVWGTASDGAPKHDSAQAAETVHVREQDPNTSHPGWGSGVAAGTDVTKNAPAVMDKNRELTAKLQKPIRVPYQKDWSAGAIQDTITKLVHVDDLSSDSSQKFNFRGTCLSCGWQTLGMTDLDVRAITASHAQRHLVGN